jgi:hypothetical protein
MSLDTLLGIARARACLAGPLSISGDLYADGGGTAKPLTGMMSPASEQVQMLQGQGVIDGRRATLMLGEAAVTTAISRALRPGDEWRMASGSYAGTWVVEAANIVRGGWQRADLRWERMATTTSAQEKR